MNGNKDYSWVPGVVVVIAIITGFIVFSSVNQSSNTSKTNYTDNVKTPTVDNSYKGYTSPANTTTTTEEKWHCVDVTSYNQNAYDDNKCTKGSEVRYVSDSQAVSLDPSYSPGKAGASYYNNR